MPNDSTSRTLTCLIAKLPGSIAPIRAQGAFTPTPTFAAPHTTMMGCASPTPTLHIFNRYALGCLITSSTSPIVTPLKAGATASSASTSSPAMLRVCANASLERVGLTQVRNQFSENFMARYSIELFEKAQIALVKQAQIVNAIMQHRQTLYPQTESKTEILFTVNLDVLQHIRMNHATTADFQPTTIPAHINLGRRLGKRKE